MVKIAVVGAGAVGLSTAINIQEQLPTARVTIVADKFGKDTLSDGAGGVFRPTLQHIEGVPEPTVRKWCQASWDWFFNLALSQQASEAGSIIISGTLFYNTPKNPIYKDLIVTFRQMTSTELAKFKVPHKYGYFATSLIMDMRKYLPWMMRKFRDRGGQIHHKTLTCLSELHGEYDVVVNCSGLQARQLVGDTKVYPVRGQLTRVHAPWIKHWVHTDEDIYLIPLSDCVVVGGVRQKNNFNAEVDPSDSKVIWDRAVQLFPQLEGATVVREWTGLRPHRIPPRIEKEIMTFGDRKLNVVHNYGHGGNGIALSWGTGIEAAQMVKEMVGTLKPSARL